MELKDLAPWIAIAFTLALSILVPLFTQIANNRFNAKQQELKYKHEIEERRCIAYEEFLEKVGACVSCSQAENIKNAGASIQKLLPYVSEEIREDLNNLFYEIRKHDWERASQTLKSITDKTVNDFVVKEE